jgi:hypothetical protein
MTGLLWWVNRQTGNGQCQIYGLVRSVAEALWDLSAITL